MSAPPAASAISHGLLDYVPARWGAKRAHGPRSGYSVVAPIWLASAGPNGPLT